MGRESPKKNRPRPLGNESLTEQMLGNLCHREGKKDCVQVINIHSYDPGAASLPKSHFAHDTSTIFSFMGWNITLASLSLLCKIFMTMFTASPLITFAERSWIGGCGFLWHQKDGGGFSGKLSAEPLARGWDGGRECPCGGYQQCF